MRKLKSGLTPADIAWIQEIGRTRRGLPTPKQIAFDKNISVAEVYRIFRGVGQYARKKQAGS